MPPWLISCCVAPQRPGRPLRLPRLAEVVRATLGRRITSGHVLRLRFDDPSLSIDESSMEILPLPKWTRWVWKTFDMLLINRWTLKILQESQKELVASENHISSSPYKGRVWKSTGWFSMVLVWKRRSSLPWTSQLWKIVAVQLRTLQNSFQPAPWLVLSVGGENPPCRQYPSVQPS